MRSATVEIVSGQVTDQGRSLYGPLRCRRTGLGAYTLTAPEGRDMVGISLVAATNWHFIISGSPNGRTYAIQFANSTAGSLADTSFHYHVALAA